MENKIAKTEPSIQLLEEHLTNRTCPKSLRYTAKPNITPDETFEKELKDIKLDAEQSLVDALTRFHKRKLEGQKNKLRAFSKPNARENKYVTRQPFNDTQSKNHIVNHNNVNLSDLQKPPARQEFLFSTHLQKSTNLFRSEDRSSQVVTAQLKKYPLL